MKQKNIFLCSLMFVITFSVQSLRSMNEQYTIITTPNYAWLNKAKEIYKNNLKNTIQSEKKVELSTTELSTTELYTKYAQKIIAIIKEEESCKVNVDFLD